MVHCYYTDGSINPFEIGYIINPEVNCNKVFREKVEKFLSISFHENIIETIKYCLIKKNTCVMELIMSYENNGEIPKTSV